MKTIGLLALHIISIYFLWLLWTDKRRAIERGTVMTKLGYVSKRKSPRLFYFSIWVDFVILSVLYVALIVYSIFLLFG
jgi:uncharacterized membrane protein YsdA (DUF1294 family)